MCLWGITLADYWWLFHVPVLVQSGVSRTCVGAGVSDGFTCLCRCSRQWRFHVPVLVQSSLTVSRACVGAGVSDCFTCLCWCSRHWLFHVPVLVQSSVTVSRACVGAVVSDGFTCLCWCSRHWLFHVSVCGWCHSGGGPRSRRGHQAMEGRGSLFLKQCSHGPAVIAERGRSSSNFISPLHSAVSLSPNQPTAAKTNTYHHCCLTLAAPTLFRFSSNPHTPPPPHPPLVLSSLLSRSSLWKLTDAQWVWGRLVLANALVVSFAIWEMFTISQTACLY